MSRNVIKSGSIIVGRLLPNGGLAMHPNPHHHSSPNSALAEAERLALTTPGEKFIAISVLGTVVSCGLVKE